MMGTGKIDEIIARHGGGAGSLVQVLLDIQHENRWISAEALERVSQKLDIPMSKVRHVATFFKSFDLAPAGPRDVHVCNGTSCHVRGAAAVLDAAKKAAGAESEVAVRTVNCMGCCAIGPVMVVDGKTHGGLSPAEAAEAIKRNG
jgi:NADH-quinone oxidoreductase subunit E